MWLVLAGLDDLSALWAFQGLKAHGLLPIELITAEMLAYSLRWNYRLGKQGSSTEIALADGRTIKTENIKGVLNRLTSFPSDHLQIAQPVDREYAVQEFMAFAIGWLYALPQPVLNQPTPQGLSGRWRHASEWAWLAMRAGLPVLPYRQGSREQPSTVSAPFGLSNAPTASVIVVGGQVLGEALPIHVVEGCRQLASLAETALLGIEFVPSAGLPWVFAQATPLPDLRIGGSALLDVLALLLRQEVAK